MISRRILRSKVLQTLYSYFQAQDRTINQAEKELLHSIERTYDLYHYLLLLVLEVVRFAEDKIEIGKNKYRPTYEELHPNTKFIENKFIAQLAENEHLNSFISAKGISWANDNDLIRKIYNNLVNADFYTQYMQDPDRTYAKEKKFIIDIYDKVIKNCEALYQTLEEQSIFWADTADFIISMIIKTIKKFKIGDDRTVRLMPLYKNPEDKDFAIKLFRKVVLNRDEYNEIIKKHLKNWDINRVAFTDRILLLMAVSELMEFEEIPVKVTLNEYIELAKYFSTETSNTFINGVLDRVVACLKKENKILKTGRGLIE